MTPLFLADNFYDHPPNRRWCDSTTPPPPTPDLNDPRTVINNDALLKYFKKSTCFLLGPLTFIYYTQIRTLASRLSSYTKSVGHVRHV